MRKRTPVTDMSFSLVVVAAVLLASCSLSVQSRFPVIARTRKYVCHSRRKAENFII